MSGISDKAFEIGEHALYGFGGGDVVPLEDVLELEQQLASQAATIERLRAVLEQYADPENWNLDDQSDLVVWDAYELWAKEPDAGWDRSGPKYAKTVLAAAALECSEGE